MKFWIDSLLHPLNLWCFTILSLLCFLSPGLTLARETRRRNWLEKEGDLFAVALIASGTSGYLFFWAYFFSARLGRGLSFSLVGVGLVRALCELRRKETRAEWLAPEVGLTLAAAIFYLGLCLSPQPADWGLTASAQMIGDFDLPGDNRIPYQFARALFRGEDPRDLGGGWRSGDRPPVQSGVFLAQYPLSYLSAPEGAYERCAVLFQSLWGIALIFFCRALGLSRRVCNLSFLACLCSGFFYLNSVFVWPKLASAAYFLIGLTFIALRSERAFHSVLGAASLALAMLCHGGIAFSLLPLPFLFLVLRPRPRWRLLMLAAGISVLYLLPWSLYQRWYDPPGTRLIKWHLAGAVTQDPRSVFHALVEEYAKRGYPGFWRTFGINVRGLCTFIFPEPWEWTRLYFSRWRRLDASYLLQDLGGWSLGGLGFLVMIYRRQWPHFPLGSLLGYCVGGLILWCALIFIPGTISHFVGSYGFPFMLYPLLAYGLSALPRRAGDAVLACRVVYFFVVYFWLAGHPVAPDGLPMLVFGAGGGLWLWRASLKKLNREFPLESRRP